MKATWHGALLAQSDDTIVVEGNHYFPADSITSDSYASANLRMWMVILIWIHSVIITAIMIFEV